MSNKERGTGLELRSYLDTKDTFLSGGHQILISRRHDRCVPAWAMDDSKILQVVARSFPKLREAGSSDAAEAGRRIRVIQLYFRMKHTHGQIAEELGISYGAVRSLIRNIKRSFEGKRANGTGVLGGTAGRPRGCRDSKPRKPVPQLKHLLEGPRENDRSHS